MSHENPKAESIEWFTPPELLGSIGLRFDMDVCSPMAGPVPWVPADRFLSARENGLVAPWDGLVWCNPPFGELARKFAHRMAEHRNGIILLPARTDTRAFQGAAPRADAITFIDQRLYFIRADGRRDRSPFASVLLAFGDNAAFALGNAGLGFTAKAHPASVRGSLGL